MDESINIPKKKRRIVVEEEGPYLVEGGIPLVMKTQIVSEYGEPLTWQTGERIKTGDE